MKTVDKYLTSNFLKPFFVCIISFVCLLLFVDSAEKLRPFVSYSKTGNEDSWQVIFSYLFGSVTVYAVNFLPFVIALSGAVTHVNLNKTGQLMALYSFGLNHHRIFRFPLLISFVMGAIVLLMNFNFLPKTIREVENTSRLIRGLPNKNKAFILEENLTTFDQSLEQKRNSKDYNFSINLNPPVYQVINYGEMIDLVHFKKIIVTRLDANHQIRQRFLLNLCEVEDSFIQGQSGIMQDYYANGDLYKETIITDQKPVFVKINIYGEKLLDVIALHANPKQSSLKNLLEHYHLKVARDEICKRLLMPIHCVMLLLLALALSCYFNLKNIYMCFTVMILVALIEMIISSIPVLFFGSVTTVIPIFLTPVLLFLTAKLIFKIARI